LEPGDGPLWSYSGYIPIFAMSVNVSSFRLLSVCPRQGLAGYGYLNFPIFDSDFLAHDVRVGCEATITAHTVRHDQVLWIAYKPFSCNAVETGF
jgi:hypothetical protein